MPGTSARPPQTLATGSRLLHNLPPGDGQLGFVVSDDGRGDLSRKLLQRISSGRPGSFTIKVNAPLEGVARWKEDLGEKLVKISSRVQGNYIVTVYASNYFEAVEYLVSLEMGARALRAFGGGASRGHPRQLNTAWGTFACINGGRTLLTVLTPIVIKQR